MKRENVLTGSPWEDKMGYCRAVHIVNIVEVSGTVTIVDEKKAKADDAYSQTIDILEWAEKVLKDLKAIVKDVIRTRIFKLTSILLMPLLQRMLLFLKIQNQLQDLYEISKLIAPDYLVEIEFTAVLPEKQNSSEGL
jgi:enamine deaminase RidA (YjgF/YER057c/UK114 family)